MTEDRTIISQARNGNPRAQQKLYSTYKGLWYSICLRYMNERDDALDSLQNGMVKIYSNLNQFDDTKGSFKSWSAKIMVNECIMYQRKYWKPQHKDNVDLELVDSPFESDVFSSLGVKELTKMIQTLPVGYKLVFNMYAIEGYSHKEISDKLGVSVGTSKSQLFKAKKLLQNKLKAQDNIDQVMYSQHISQ
jgi:RNA polymerase sigma-70 factor (ECF subfamily)